MNSFKKLNNIVGWLVFGFATVVYYFSVERSGSLWDCGEFVSGCLKLQVVHPPGAPLFLIIGRIFTLFSGFFSSEPSGIAFAVNMLSGLCSAFTALFICWSTIILGKLTLVGREEEPTLGQYIALAAAGIVAGLSTAFATSVWFSGVEGEVYAMSNFFTGLTVWAMMKWYNQPDTPQADRWMLFAVYAAGLSTGVHLLSLLTFPALALFYYFKKTEKPTITGVLGAGVVGTLFIGLTQSVIITGIPKLWGNLEIFCVNYLSLPKFWISLVLLLAIIGGAIYYGLKLAFDRKNRILQNIVVAAALLVVSSSTIGVVLIRANANPPINMNNPSDPLRIIPYLNREQYGDRPLIYGPQFNSQPIDISQEDRYGYVASEGKYEAIDRKIDYVYDSGENVLFPRMGHGESDRPAYYKIWMGLNPDAPLPADRPDQGDNISYFARYQVGWMYWRYLMWNFSGRQNGEQGYTPADLRSGHWISGIPFIDQTLRGLPAETNMPTDMRTDFGKNKYYMLPFIFGLLGLIYHIRRRQFDALGVFALFLLTGIGIIIYTNQPPNEPRERDYAIVGSIFTFTIWIGMGVLAIFDLLSKAAKLPAIPAAAVSGVLVLSAPMLMLQQNFDDHSRSSHRAARDYAHNFLQSTPKNGVLFTYGDNDTYPLWYTQETEGVRTDVRVVNLSLIAVDWYIFQQNRKVNESSRIKMSLPEASIRGFKRNQLAVQNGPAMDIQAVLKFAGEDHPMQTGNGGELESYIPTRNIYIPIDKQKMIANGLISANDTGVVDRIEFTLSGNYITKDDLAIMDIIANNINDRPICFAVTARSEKMLGLDDYMQLEGLTLRLVPFKTASEKAYGIIGSGRVNTDSVFNKVTKTFLWGNFNKERTFVDKSYKPSIATMQFSIIRTAEAMLNKGEKEKVVELVDKVFFGFPNNNFPYDAQTLYLLRIYVDAGAYEKGKKHFKLLEENLFQNLKFYTSLSQKQLEGGFQSDYYGDLRAKEQLIALVTKAGDTAYKAELEKRFEKFKLPQQPPQMN